MKKVLAIVLVVILSLSLCSCGSGLYYDYNMKKYVTVEDYPNDVETQSVDFIGYVNQFYASTFGDEFTYDAVDGIVQNGETVNINFTGYMDGEAFEGGTAENYELTIGSGSFIDGFEIGLIGVEVGKTVSLNLKFPDPYPNNTDLSGKPVVFEVKVNSVKRYQLDDKSVADYGYSSVKEFEKAAELSATQYCMFNNIYEAASVIKYPEKEVKALVDSEVNYYKSSAENNGMTFEDFLTQYNLTEGQFRTDLEENYIKPNMLMDMLCYYILQVNDQKLTKVEVEAKRAELEELYGEEIGEDLEISLQKLVAQEKALKIIGEQAKLK